MATGDGRDESGGGSPEMVGSGRNNLVKSRNNASYFAMKKGLKREAKKKGAEADSARYGPPPVLPPPPPSSHT